jgi:hypothetical protein
MRSLSWFCLFVLTPLFGVASLPGCDATAVKKAEKAVETAVEKPVEAADGWQSLFDGKSLDGWKVNENPDTFAVRDGEIVVNGPRAHLFYEGPVNNHDFKNFEFKAEVMTKPGSNSGIYFHTEFGPGWPAKGYEVQVNNTHKDVKKTGGLYGIQDVLEIPAKDNEWFTEEIIVRGKHIVTKVDGKTLVDWTEPDGFEAKAFPGRKVDHGTFALQGHDPKSEVHFRNIRVKPLPDDAK